MSRALKNKTRGSAKRRSAEIRNGGPRDGSGVQKFDGAENKAAGTKGKEPGGRWSEAYYESDGKIIKTY